MLTAAWYDGRPDTPTAFERLGKAYLKFARDDPASYSAMFESGIPVDTFPALSAASERAFSVIRTAAERLAAPPARASVEVVHDPDEEEHQAGLTDLLEHTGEARGQDRAEDALAERGQQHRSEQDAQRDLPDHGGQPQHPCDHPAQRRHREERGQGARSAVEEVVDTFELPVIAVARLRDLMEHLQAKGDEAAWQSVRTYRDQYGSA